MFKQSKQDGRLPLTRKAQLGYILRNEMGILFLINFLTFLFVVPLFLCLFFGVLSFGDLASSGDASNAKLFNVFLMYGLLSIPCFILLGIGASGLFATIKRLVFYSTASVSEYFKGIKEHFVTFFKFFFTLGILFGLLIINIGFLLYIEFNMTFKVIVLGINALLLLTFIIATPFATFELVTFNNYFFAYLRNGIYLFYKCLPLSLLSLLLTVLPAIMFLVIPLDLFFIPLGILATFYLSLAALVIFIISIYSYERLVPAEDIPEIYHKGLENINL